MAKQTLTSKLLRLKVDNSAEFHISESDSIRQTIYRLQKRFFDQGLKWSTHGEGSKFFVTRQA